MNFFTTSILALVFFYILLLSAVFLFQRNLLYHPSVDNYLKDQIVKEPTEIEKVKITTSDKIDLIGWFYKKDLKQFKDCKLNVSISRSANCQSLTVKLKKCDDPNKLKKEQDYLSICPNFYKQIEDIINQYNFDKSHLPSDYCHVNFFTHIDCDL